MVPTGFEINFYQAIAVSVFEDLVAKDGFLGIGALGDKTFFGLAVAHEASDIEHGEDSRCGAEE